MDISETGNPDNPTHIFIYDRYIDMRIVTDVANSMPLPSPVKNLLLGTGEFSTWSNIARTNVFGRAIQGDESLFDKETWKRLDPVLEKYSAETILAGMFDTDLSSKAMDAVKMFTTRYTGRRAFLRMGVGAAAGMTGGNALDTLIRRWVPEQEEIPDATLRDGIEYPTVERVSPIPPDDVLENAQILGGGALGAYAASRTLDQVRFVKSLCDVLTLHFANRVSKIRSGEITVDAPSMAR